jgi:hypothetical protein
LKRISNSISFDRCLGERDNRFLHLLSKSDSSTLFPVAIHGNDAFEHTMAQFHQHVAINLLSEEKKQQQQYTRLK